MSTADHRLQAPPANARVPRQIPFIIGNEACERFSFYGMRNILTPFLVTSLLLYAPEAERAGIAKEVFHSFVIGVYFFPLLGGWIADRLLGKYRTILWLSLVYCAGHACLAAFDDNRTGFYTGLFLIALGSGGIKPLVVSFVGDQFDQSNKHIAKVAFDAFYWSINFGSFFASLFMPILLREYGAALAFGVPGILMFIATVIFWAGRKKYVHVPPAPADPHSFLRVARTALWSRVEGQGRPGLIIAAIGAAFALDGALIRRIARLRGVRLSCPRLPAGVRRHRRLSTTRSRTRAASPGAHRWRPGRVAHPHRVRARDAVLVAVRSKSIDVDLAGGSDGEARVVLIGADAGAESGAGHAPDSLQQPGPVSGAAPPRRRGDGAAADGFRHRIFGTRVDRGGRHPALDRRRRAGFHRLAGAAVCAAHFRRGTRVGDGARVCLQPGAAVHEGRDHGVLVSVDYDRQPLGAVGQRQRAQRGGVVEDRRHRTHGSPRF